MTDVVDEDQAVTTEPATPAPDPEAPFGRRADGTPYKRDPSFFAHLRKGGAGAPAGRRTKRRPAAGAKPVQPAPSRRPAGKPEYAKRIVQLGALGLPLVPNPVDRKVVEIVLPQWAASVERLALTYPAIAQILDRILLAGDGAGPALDFVMATVTAGGLIALNHGATHPLLVTMFGAQLQAITVAALEQQAQEHARAAELRAMLHPPAADDEGSDGILPGAHWAG